VRRQAPGPPLAIADARGYNGGVVTDLAEVARLGTAKAAENLVFRRYLSAHHCGDKRFQILASEVQRHVDCTACANCCRHSVVSVTHSEVDRIASYLAAAPETVVRLYTDPDAGAPALRILKNSGNACVFLDGNLCTIYEARPKACRDFPHVAIGSHSLGSRAASHDHWAALCPIIFNALESYKHLTGFHPRTAPHLHV